MKTKYVVGFLIFCMISQAAASRLIWPSSLRDPFAQASEDGTPHSTVIFFHYLDPKELDVLLNNEKAHVLSPGAVFLVQIKEHALWVQGTADDVHTIRTLVAGLDRPKQQLLLKARMVSVDNQFAHDLGTLFESSQTGMFNDDALQSTNEVSGFTVPIANLRNGYLLDVRLSALEKMGHAKVISSPELVTLDHVPAIIESGDEIPYQQETANGGTSVSFKKAVLKLEVTPHILAHQHILLDVDVDQDKVGLLTVQGVPTIHTQQVSTEIEVKNKQTFVLGGIYEVDISNEKEGVPYLKNIPLVGYLFQAHHRLNEQREMLIFITVEIMPP